MYLKSIEVQGFKSFANKIVFDFHNGITGIVGPNGSGKSNVADAVRWVLGEQSAKQLRGSKMEDVIFAGTEARKPVGFAYVSITLDNADHALPVEYDEVTVTRRVYRSGESEYQMNGHNCRLKDISELFYDTGIGKEGYSIIGQGQIDKILSGKPEDRRELFDEAAGIVKFKRRKASAQKKLDSERANLVRVNDILSELEKQVGPLEKQSEKARQYLKLKEELKILDVNGFLLETDKLKADLKGLEEKLAIADSDLAQAKESYEATKAEYEKAEEELNRINEQIETHNTQLSEKELTRQRLTGEIQVFEEQIKTIQVNAAHYQQRMTAIENETAHKNTEINGLNKQKEELSGQLAAYGSKQEEAQRVHEEILAEIERITAEIENRQNSIFEILNEKSTINADNQKYKTMLEQLNIRKAELSSRIIRGKSEESAQDSVIRTQTGKLDTANEAIKKLTEQIEQGNAEVVRLKEQIATGSSEIDKKQQQYHREKSRLESLVNITERYDGYGNSIRKIMELKEQRPGILGVIADIVKVEKQYETAIETALGGTIQNIVTDNENTAKDLIAYLKQNRFGRATFLPLSAIQVRNTLEGEPCMKEKGVIGAASDLVRVSFEYEKLAKYLLGRILVVDNIDNALAIARKYRHSLRIVTLEGEQLNPGGSMTGGAFKNSSNLLGRRREIEELKAAVSAVSAEITKSKEQVAGLRAELAEVRQTLEQSNKQMREEQLSKNTAELNLRQSINKKKEIITYKPITHIAFIMDGNGRWAKKRMMPRSYGHHEGVKRIKETLYLCLDYNIKVMTLFCFSTENWKRDKKEIDYLFSLFDEFFKTDIVELNQKGCKVQVMGDVSKLPLTTQHYISEAKRITCNNDKIILNICLNYGGRDEITYACKKIAKQVKLGLIDPDKITEQTINDNLMSAGLPDVDVMVRTSGEQRISNFVLWQIAYAELIFIKDPWPDFKKKQFLEVLEEFTKRDRRFGGINYGGNE